MTAGAFLSPKADLSFRGAECTPSQWEDMLKRSIRLPEHRLLVALLLDAYRLLFVCKPGSRPIDTQERRHAIEWVRDKRDGEESPYLFPFPQVCFELKLPWKDVRLLFIQGYKGTIQRRRTTGLRVSYADYAIERPDRHHRGHAA